jgi:deoxyribodipyrimidine photo-lyase
MRRDQRVEANWAVLHAAMLAREAKASLHLAFCLRPQTGTTSIRHLDFMLAGLPEVDATCRRHGIPFHLLIGDPKREIPALAKTIRAGAIVTDFSPLRGAQHLRDALAAAATITFHEVDAHNIVPAWIASSRLEFAARTFRPRINRELPEYLVPFAYLPRFTRSVPEKIDWQKVRRRLKTPPLPGVTTGIRPGRAAGLDVLARFIGQGLAHYDEDRNNPNRDGQSGLSPYIHLGQVGAQEIALAVRSAKAPAESKEVFLEELIVRRELADNYCLRNPDYDSFEGLHPWAKRTLDAHRRDRRAFLYSEKEFERAKTHDPLWNAAQIEMTMTGKMHGFMRMYWAKKILEWTPSPEDAFRIANALNDRYSLDGRDPNGYVGIAWSVGGAHDRAWTERPVFGKIRYMNDAGCRRKFDVKEYIRRHAT